MGSKEQGTVERRKAKYGVDESEGAMDERREAEGKLASDDHGLVTSLATRKNRRIAYFHYEEASVFDHSASHPRKPFRAKLAHDLLLTLNLYQELAPMRPRLVTMTDFAQFHSDNYIGILRFLQEYLNPVSELSLENGGIGTSEDKDDARIKASNTLKRFNLGLQTGAPNEVFAGILDYCRIYTSGTLGCAIKLMQGEADVGINWYGGMTHARVSSAHAGCYINDCVLAILLLLRTYTRVLFISVDGEHCDAVEEAFYTNSNVMTMSFHARADRDEYPGTGDAADTGYDQGFGYAVNIPFAPGLRDETLVSVFGAVVTKAYQAFEPQVVIYQSGANIIAGDRFGVLNVTTRAHGECLRITRDLGLPMLVLGGSGTHLGNTARLWAYQTSCLLDKTQDLPSYVPFETKYREYFGPDFRLHSVERIMVDENTPEYIDIVRRKVLLNLEKVAKIRAATPEPVSQDMSMSANSATTNPS